jgi:hypothetical protein
MHPLFSTPVENAVVNKTVAFFTFFWSTSMSRPTRVIITGVPPYNQTFITLENGKRGQAGCAPMAALMLMAWYDRALGYYKLIKPVPESKETELPEALLLKLRKRMATSNFELDSDGSQSYGLTFPPAFREGLKSYIKQYYDVSVKTKASTGFNTLKGVFEKSRELIDNHKPHVLLLDYDKDVMPGWIGGKFPDHYVVVVGYSVHNGNQKLVVNNGEGDNFQIVDMTRKDIKPARIYWLDMKDQPDGPADGHQIGPQEEYTWTVVRAIRKTVLVPTIKKWDGSEYFEWPHADDTISLTPHSDCSVCLWYE